MSTLSLRKIKHDSSSVDNIVTNTDGGVGLGGIDPSTLPGFIDHAVKVQNGGGLGIQSTNATDNRWIFFGHGTTSGDVQRAGIVNQGSDQSLALATAGSQKLIVDVAGRVTVPYQPAFMAVGTDGRAGYAAGTDFVYTATRFNIGNHYSTSTGRFTAPITARYAFYANTMGDATDARLMIRLVINGTDYHQGSSSSNGSQYQDSKLFVLAQLNAGDYVYVRNVGNKSTYDFNQLENWFCGYLVS